MANWLVVWQHGDTTPYGRVLQAESAAHAAWEVQAGSDLGEAELVSVSLAHPDEPCMGPLLAHQIRMAEQRAPGPGADHLTLLNALEEAAEYRRDGGPDRCSDCTASGLCENHQTDEAVASMYDELHARLQGGT